MADLKHRQQLYAQNLASGMTSEAAARAAGYSASYSKVLLHRAMARPAVAEAVESVREEGRKLAAYDLATALREADDAAAFAKLHKSAMALVQARTLKSKLAGLLIDKVQIEPIDIAGALQRARLRVVNPLSITKQDESSPSTDGEDGSAEQG